MTFDINDAIDLCRGTAAGLDHNPQTAHKYTKMAMWLEQLRDAPEHIEAAVLNRKIDYAPPHAEDTIYDMRERQRDRTIEQVVEILKGLSE